MRRLYYRLIRGIIKLIARPKLTGVENLPEQGEVVYVLHKRAISDLAVLDLACGEALPSPLSPLKLESLDEESRFFPLMRATGGRITMREQPARMRRLVDADETDKQQIYLVPVSVFWGRAMGGEGSVFKALTSEHWAVTGRFKRLINLVINRRNIWAHLGRPILLAEVSSGIDREIAYRRTARFLRVRLRQQRMRSLGPDFSHRRTLIDRVVGSRAVRDAIRKEASSSGKKPHRVRRQAERYARTLASDMNHPTIRVLARLLTWFWHKIYNGIELNGLKNIDEMAETHTLVYVPSHRSHLDYLLLSYLLYYEGHMIPHIAAGDNLNLPVIGSILRRGGAFFMRRSFRDSQLYVAVFEEYLYQVYREGHCVEFFPEGGRSRTGRLLPARLGLLKMTAAAQHRGLPKPLAFVPVYFSYEKLVEGNSYVAELRGADKKKESVTDVFRNIRLIRQNFGHVTVSIGEPIALIEHEQTHATAPGFGDNYIGRLGRDIMIAINQQAYVNPINLVALVTLCTPKTTIEASLLAQQIRIYQSLLKLVASQSPIRYSELDAEAVINYAEDMGLLQREDQPFGEIVSHAPFTAVLMTWYRNNVLHTLALPAMIACMLVRRRRGLKRAELLRIVNLIYPFLARELSAPTSTAQFDQFVQAMARLKLLKVTDGVIAAPPLGRQSLMQLNLLSNLVMPTLQRMYIVIRQLREGPVSRAKLQKRSQLVAQKISRLYGIDAPEFSDAKLFDLFIDGLEANQAVTLTDAGLVANPIIEEVLKAADFVIDPQIRFAVVTDRAALEAK